MDQQVIELSPIEKGQNILKNSDGVQMRHMGLPETGGVFSNETPRSCAKEVETQVYFRKFWVGEIVK